MATAIGFKKVDVLPANPLKSTFYWVGETDIYYGSKKLNNEDDLKDAVDRLASLETVVAAMGGGSGGGPISIGAGSINIEDAANKFQATNVEDALAELANKIGPSTAKYDSFSVLLLSETDWTGSVVDGGRNWHTATIPYKTYNDGMKVIRAIPCGSTIDIMPLEKQEMLLYAMKAYLYPDDMNVVFYSPTIPDISLTVALEGVEFDL